MGKRRTTNRPEGGHGEKTHARKIEELQSSPPEESRDVQVERNRAGSAREGGRRVVEDREQHDDAERTSERTQLFVKTKHGTDDGPSDNSGNLHGVLGHREQRADYKEPTKDAEHP